MYYTHSMYITCIMHLCTCVISMRIMHNTCYIFYIYIYYNCIAFLLCKCNDFVFSIITNLRVPCHTQKCSMAMTSLAVVVFSSTALYWNTTYVRTIIDQNVVWHTAGELKERGLLESQSLLSLEEVIERHEHYYWPSKALQPGLLRKGKESWC